MTLFIRHTKQVLSAKFIEDSNKFVSASHDSTLRIWDLRAKACVGTKFAGSYCNDVICVDTNIISGHFVSHVCTSLPETFPKSWDTFCRIVLSNFGTRDLVTPLLSR